MIKAEVNSVQFYQEKSKGLLSAGIYKVIEHDDTINYCELNGFGGEKWYDETEWAMKEEELKKDPHSQSGDEPIDLYAEWQDEVNARDYNDCSGCGTCHLCNSDYV